MNRQRDRDEFIAIMAQEKVPVDVARKLLHAGASLQRIAELQCSSEAADRDRVPCPGARHQSREAELASCLCEHWSGCGCPETAAGALVGSLHHPVPRINVREAQIEKRVTALCAPYGIKPVFNGDPRGAVLKLQVPSGRTNDWGREGVCVP